MEGESKEIVFDINDKTLTHDEIWDDTLLIQQYDQSMAEVQKKVTKKISLLNSTATESDHSESIVEDGDGCCVRLSGAINKEMDLSFKKKKKKNKKNKKKTDWHTGDVCRGRFSEDKRYYEATIIAMNPQRTVCTVRFVGYNNEEEMAVKNLLPSKGVDARIRQETAADVAACSAESDFGSSIVDSDLQSDTDGDRSSKMGHPCMPQKSFPNMMPPPSTAFSGASFAPPSHLPDLPPPPSLTFNPKDDQLTTEALHTMLMSWYMTGYHTGYYQGICTQNSKKKFK